MNATRRGWGWALLGALVWIVAGAMRAEADGAAVDVLSLLFIAGFAVMVGGVAAVAWRLIRS